MRLKFLMPKTTVVHEVIPLPLRIQGRTPGELSERRLSKSEAMYRNQANGAGFDTAPPTQPTHLSAPDLLRKGEAERSERKDEVVRCFLHDFAFAPLFLPVLATLVLVLASECWSASTLARLSFWAPPERMTEFEAAYQEKVAPILKKRGLVESSER